MPQIPPLTLTIVSVFSSLYSSARHFCGQPNNMALLWNEAATMLTIDSYAKDICYVDVVFHK